MTYFALSHLECGDLSQMVLYLHGFSFFPCFSPDIDSVTSNQYRTGVWVFIHCTSHSFFEVFLFRCILNNGYHQDIIISIRQTIFSPLKQIKLFMCKIHNFASNQLDVLFISGRLLQITNKMLHVILHILHKYLYQKTP